MLRATIATALLFGVGAFAQQSQTNTNTNNQKGQTSSTSTRSETSTTSTSQSGQTSSNGAHSDGRTLTSQTDKAGAYDKWTDERKMSVSKGMGRDMSTMSTTERTTAWGKMTPEEKAAAYDYYIAHPDTTTTKQTN